MNELITKGEKAKKAARLLSVLPTGVKNTALLTIADGLAENSAYIIEQNSLDIEDAKRRNTPSAMLDRLLLDEKRISAMAEGIRQIADLPDPIGRSDGMVKTPIGLLIGKIRVPIGVIGIIYEARPNVTADSAALCLKAGNAVILRGGSDAIRSNIAISDIMCREAQKAGIPDGAVSLIMDTSRETAVNFMKLNGYIDLLIPRGGAGLIKTVVNNATVPVIETGAGNCHIYIEKTADLNMAKRITVNAKTSRPSVCNAAETLLADRDAAKTLLPPVLTALEEKGVEIRGCPETREIFPHAGAASGDDWGTEYNDYIIAVKVVNGIDEAIEHITKYGTKHSEAIITSDYNMSQKFLAEVDAAAVYVNASTRFTDGFEFGFGAEIGISTQKIHARGPMGLNELTSLKYIIYGNGQIRE
ncbi:MAG: glutamate-5-semialdehyde dehydrogenase [Deferribacteraceae bacterium]|jgi:glutamate-5-semialdehyde dehydrogenase|nr:glutamate-5-semialdehyde dehydrogenase [Deferribacteraceae bacterium]